MPITMDDVANMLATAQRFRINKAQQTAEGANTVHSLWKAAGQPAAGANPPAFSAGSGYVPTDATTGAFVFTNPATGKTYLVRAGMRTSTLASVILYDRVWACSGFGTVVTTAQNVTTPGSLTRPDVNGTGCEIWGEVYTAPGATGATWTVTYTNQAGTGSRTSTYTHPANAESVGQMFNFPLQSGDTGVQSIQSFQCSVSSGTAGDIGLTIVYPIVEIGIATLNVMAGLDFAALGMPEIKNDACLALMVACTTTNTGVVAGEFALGQV